MTNDERKEYVNYRIESAHKTFNAEKILAENGFWNSAVNSPARIPHNQDFYLTSLIFKFLVLLH